MKMNSVYLELVKNKKTLFLVFVLVHIFVLTIVVWKTYPWITGDSDRYLALSSSFGSSEGFGLKSNGIFEPEGWRMPGYPLFIFISNTVINNSHFGIILLQAILYIVSVWLVWKITSEIFNHSTATIFLLLSSGYPFVMYSVGQISPEIPTVFLLSLAVYLLLKPTTKRVLVAVILVSLSAYFRPNLLLLNGVILFCFFLFNYRDWRKPALVLITAVLMAAPYTVRNYVVFGKLTPLPVISGAGNPLMIAVWSSKISLKSLIKYARRENTEELTKSGMLEQISEINRKVGVPEDTIYVTPESYPTNETKLRSNELLLEQAYLNISNDPLSFAKVVSLNAVRMWFSSTFPENYPFLFGMILLAQGILVAFLGLVGSLIAVKSSTDHSRFIVFLLCGMSVYFILTLSWSHTEARYTISIRLFVIMFASYAIYEICKLLKTLFWSKKY